MPNSKGFRTRTRKLLQKSPREKGLQPLGRLLTKYNVGDNVLIRIDPSIQKGMPHRRYHGKSGVISEIRGRTYVVNIKTGNAYKQIIARPEHVYLITNKK